LQKEITCLAAVPLLLIAATPQPPAARPAGAGISVVSLNLAKETGLGRMLRELRATPALRDADILMFQEVKEEPVGRECAAARVASELGLHVAWAPAAPDVNDRGLAILSRHPLRDVQVHRLKEYNLRFRSRVRFALAATADMPRGPVRVYNAHLDTRLNSAERLEQLAGVVAASMAFNGPRIIGGDFNTNPFYWIGRVLPFPLTRPQGRGVEDYMSRHGFRNGLVTARSTYDYLGMQLDWIWVRGLEVRASRVYPVEFSDHHAIWTHVE
jgi:endonuclease/exonuclease/phosphatase family metal-dependent hydrolase